MPEENAWSSHTRQSRFDRGGTRGPPVAGPRRSVPQRHSQIPFRRITTVRVRTGAMVANANAVTTYTSAEEHMPKRERNQKQNPTVKRAAPQEETPALD